MNQPDVKHEILSQSKTIAVVGLSARPSRAGHYVPAYLQEHGYRIIPVNPYLAQELGEKAYPDLKAVPEPVDLVLVFRQSKYLPEIVDQAIAIGAKALWTQFGVIHEQAAEKARAAGLKVVIDACMMIEHRAYEQSAPPSARSS